jgi:predicted kinase
VHHPDFQAYEETLRRRVAHRRARADDASEADLVILQRQLAVQEPLTADEQACTFTLDTDAPQAIERLLQTVQAMAGEH